MLAFAVYADCRSLLLVPAKGIEENTNVDLTIFVQYRMYNNYLRDPCLLKHKCDQEQRRAHYEPFALLLFYKLI